MTTGTIEELFHNDIRRRIEEVIKVDQDDREVVRAEIQEYVVTDVIQDHYLQILERYQETPNKPHEGVAVWVSGFFGSGKSSFAKMLGLALEDRDLGGEGAAEMFARRTGSSRIEVVLKNITEQIPSEVVLFDVSTDRGIRSGNQTLTEIMYRLFLKQLGYAQDLDLSELEITLEQEGRLKAFESTYEKTFGKPWDEGKRHIMFALQQASKVMHILDPSLYPDVNDWRESAAKRADITPGRLAERCQELMQRRRPDKSLVFVVDEVGQFVSRDVQKMLDLQAIVQSLGRVGRGKMWIVVTSQEKLNELVGGLDDKRVELARLMDRFPLQVHLEPSDISEVTSKRVLAKKAEAQSALRGLYDQVSGRLRESSKLTADIKLPELDASSFMELYPLLPYHIDLIIQIVSGLRTQGGASKHVGGANRTIIKLAQQLLIHPDVEMASQELGALVPLDAIYDLVSGNISSEIRGKIDDIGDQVDHPLAQRVAKVICLLQYVKSVHRTEANIAATLLDRADGARPLAQVREALDELVKGQMIRKGEDGYRIPTPAEDDWDTTRAQTEPRHADIMRIQAEVLDSLWEPQPSHTLMGVKSFRAGLFFNGKELSRGEVPFHVELAEEGEFAEREEGLRTRSQSEQQSLFWIARYTDAINRELVEYFRSREMLARKERDARTKDETALVAEEKTRMRRHQDELRRLIRQELLGGRVYFRGNDRSPGDGASDVRRTVGNLLAGALPQIFERFEEAAARVQKKDLDSLMTTSNLRGLPPVFTDLNLLSEENGAVVFCTESGPLAEVFSRIQNRTSYGELASGRWLADELSGEPFGWDFDVVRLFVVSLLRAGKIKATSQGQAIEAAVSLQARNTFGNNNKFRQATFLPRVSGCEFEDLLQAAEHFEEVFGESIPAIEENRIAQALRRKIEEVEQPIGQVHGLLQRHGLPGADVLGDALGQLRSIRTSSIDSDAILSFNGSWAGLQDAIRRSAELEKALSEDHLETLRRARRALGELWPVLEKEPDLDGGYHDAYVADLQDRLARETFFKEFVDIEAATRRLEEDHGARVEEAAERRVEVYNEALQQLERTPGWAELEPAQKDEIAGPLRQRTVTPDGSTPLSLLRADIDACPGRLQQAVERMLQLHEGQRLVKLPVSKFFAGGIENEDQLEAALQGLRDECEKLIGAGKKILVQ